MLMDAKSACLFACSMPTSRCSRGHRSTTLTTMTVQYATNGSRERSSRRSVSMMPSMVGISASPCEVCTKRSKACSSVVLMAALAWTAATSGARSASRERASRTPMSGSTTFGIFSLSVSGSMPVQGMFELNSVAALITSCRAAPPIRPKPASSDIWSFEAFVSCCKCQPSIVSGPKKASRIFDLVVTWRRASTAKRGSSRRPSLTSADTYTRWLPTA
mmetsp:Transcript_73611/g.209661  ORF Transcript_73611/g.209661 Transcript_73611/m.209661 type:complete len:218 (-) Transcript_73611:897-1550(-)